MQEEIVINFGQGQYVFQAWIFLPYSQGVS